MNFVGPVEEIRWRMPVGVHGIAGSNPAPSASPKRGLGISRRLLSPVRKACGECRRNYIESLGPVRLRGTLCGALVQRKNNDVVSPSLVAAGLRAGFIEKRGECRRNYNGSRFESGLPNDLFGAVAQW